jgi:transcriptional regulator with XRE-family HTH domain
MAKLAEPDRAILERLADALGVPVERFFTGSLPVDTDECLHLWSVIRTAEGRLRALEALRAIAAEEGGEI